MTGFVTFADGTHYEGTPSTYYVPGKGKVSKAEYDAYWAETREIARQFRIDEVSDIAAKLANEIATITGREYPEVLDSLSKEDLVGAGANSLGAQEWLEEFRPEYKAA